MLRAHPREVDHRMHDLPLPELPVGRGLPGQYPRWSSFDAWELVAEGKLAWACRVLEFTQELPPSGDVVLSEDTVRQKVQRGACVSFLVGVDLGSEFSGERDAIAIR